MPDSRISALEAPFNVSEVRWKPQATSGERGLAVAYISARAVMDRLDAVFPFAWESTHQTVEAAPSVYAVEATISIHVSPGDGSPSRIMSRSDVGTSDNALTGPSADRHKSAYSDALKRAAVKWGIGRYLYGIPKAWVEFDPTRKVFTPAGLAGLNSAYLRLMSSTFPGVDLNALAARLTTQEASELHRFTANLGVPTRDHLPVVANIIGREIASYTQLSAADAELIRARLTEHRAAQLEAQRSAHAD